MKVEDRILELALEEVLGGASPPDLRTRILAAARRAPVSGLLPAGLGMAAGVLMTLGIWGLMKEPAPSIWERERGKEAWQRVEKGALISPSSSWREFRLADGTAVDLAPDTRLMITGIRPGMVARLDRGTAWFAVPKALGEMSIGVPGGKVEVVGTQFGISVKTNPKKGEENMDKKNPWMIGSAAAVVAIGVTSGVIRYVDATGAPTEVKANERLEVDREGAKHLVALREKEGALQNRERDLAEREKGLEEETRRMAEREKAAVKPVPANLEREAMLAELEKMWKESKEMHEGESQEDRADLGRMLKRMAGGEEYLQMGADGPEVRDVLAKILDLQPAQAQTMNAPLQIAYRDYLTLEASHLKQTKGEDGAVHVEIQAYEADGKGVQDRLWSQLDSTLTPHQREVARTLMLQSLDDLFLDFGASKRTITISKGKSGFDYEEKYGQGSTSGSGGPLPPKFQKFWKE